MADEDTTVEQTDAEEETQDTEATAPDPSKDQIDYDADRQAEETREADRKKAEQAFKERQQKRGTESAAEDDDDKPLTRREARELLNQVTSRTDQTIQSQRAETLAASLASSDAEKAAILAKWRNRTFPADMPLQEQIEEMHAVVNRKRLIAVNSELARANKAKDGVSHNAASTHRDPPPAGEPKLSAADKVGYRGFVWDGSSRLYKKPLGGGKKHIWKDPKSKRSWVE